MGFFLMMLRYSFVERFGDLALSVARQLVFAVVGRPTRRRATTLSWTEDNLKIAVQGEHGDGVGAVVAAVAKFFAIAFERDFLGEHATAHVQHDIDKVIWLDNSGGEDDAVEAAFFV